MSNNKKDLPANSENNPKKDDQRFQQQEEFDERGKDELQKESEARNTQRTEQMRDSQQGNERMVPESKAKESPADYKEDRKMPYIKK